MIVRVPLFYRCIYPSLLCRIPTDEKKLFLTFDDGPHPVITSKVIDLLNQFNARGTFFCVGENVKKYPDVFSLLKKQNFAVGNHTFHHLNGFKNSLKKYLHDVQLADAIIDSGLFRPPYGKLSPAQYFRLRQKYTIAMWDVISYDFDQKISKKDCFKYVIRYSRSGSIIVFHDSDKAEKNLLYALPKTLEHFQKRGYVFESL